METIQTRIADATARLSLVTSSHRYPDRQIRGACTPTSTKPGDGDPGCLLLCDGSILCKPPPSPALPSLRVSCLLCLLPLLPLFPFNPFHPSSHIPIFTHHRTVLSSLVLPTPTSSSVTTSSSFSSDRLCLPAAATAASFTLGGLVHRCTG